MAFRHFVTILIHEINWILLLYYELTLPKYNINNTRFVGFEICAIGRYTVLPRIPSFVYPLTQKPVLYKLHWGYMASR
jgi:hypothetical protein